MRSRHTGNAQGVLAGNALFLILIAVALFAALAYAVTRSGAGGGGGTSREQMELAYAEIQNIASMHISTLNRMVLSGVPVGELDFRDANGGTNASCATLTCRVYRPEGGGIPPSLIDIRNTVAHDPAAGNTQARVRYFNNWYAQGTQTADLILYIHTNRAFCLYYNQKIGVTADPDLTPSSHGVWTISSSAWTAASEPGTQGWTSTWASHLLGKLDGCYYNTNVTYGVGYKITILIWAT